MRVAARLERPAAHDQRRFVRVGVSVPAGLRAAERPFSACTVVDLSPNGCGIEIQSHVDTGARVWIALPNLESWPARVRWAEGGRAGLEFDRPLHQAVVDRYR